MTVLEFVEPFTCREAPGVVSTALGDETIEFVETCGILLDPWQQWCVRQAMAERADGSFAAFECAVITPRQNGKNYYLRALQLGYLFLMDDELLVHSAHQWDTVNVHRKWFMDLLESHDEFGSLLKPVDRRTGRSKSFVNINGDEQVVLTTGQTMVFKTRSGGKGRGFTGDKVFFDEAQDLGASSMGDTVPVLSTRPGAQVHYTGSAPKPRSTVLHSVIARGRSGDPDDKLFLAEWGNSPDVLDLSAESEEFLDRIRDANPAVAAGRISDDYVRQEIRTFSGTPELVDQHRRERLGVAQIGSGKQEGPISGDVWDSLIDHTSTPDAARCRLALDTNPERTWFSVCLAGFRSDNLVHGEYTKSHNDKSAAVRLAVDAAAKLGVPVTCSDAALAADIDTAGGTSDLMKTGEQAAACAALIDATRGEAPKLRHRGEPMLQRAIEMAATKPYGDGGIIWSRRTTSGDISPLTSLTMAYGRLIMVEPEEEFFVY